jgi:hypothetical protein
MIHYWAADVYGCSLSSIVAPFMYSDSWCRRHHWRPSAFCFASFLRGSRIHSFSFHGRFCAVTVPDIILLYQRQIVVLVIVVSLVIHKINAADAICSRMPFTFISILSSINRYFALYANDANVFCKMLVCRLYRRWVHYIGRPSCWLLLRYQELSVEICTNLRNFLLKHVFLPRHDANCHIQLTRICV